MNRKELIVKYNSFIQDFGLKQEDVIVGAGGALCLLGIRVETSDIDVDVPIGVFDKLKASGFKTHWFQDRVEVIEVTDYIDVHKRLNTDPWMVSDGVAHYTPQAILEFKQSLNREKDQVDIAALKEYIRFDTWS